MLKSLLLSIPFILANEVDDERDPPIAPRIPAVENVPQNVNTPVTTVPIQYAYPGQEVSINVDFTMQMGCGNPSISFEFEVIDYCCASSEFIKVYDDTNTLISTCDSTQQSACGGPFQDCLVNYNLGVPFVSSGDTYTVTLVQGSGVHALCSGSLTINAVLTLTCQDIDADGDSVPDDVDNCPNVPNQDQTNSDGDSFGDACDDCPNDADNDSDGDTVCGDVDNCPDTPNEGQCDLDGDGEGDACDPCVLGPQVDSDGDGVFDACDKCPGGDDNADVDSDEMPDACDICPDDGDNYSDSDNDGKPDCADNCPGESNPLQRDIDEDGVGDACDNCKFISNPNQADQDQNGKGNACDICCVENRPDACQGLSDGNYQKCDSCYGYVACSGGIKYDMPCATPTQVYNAVWPPNTYDDFCAGTSNTCPGNLPKCVPPPPPMP